MKVLKLSVIALTLGFFVTSCGSKSTEATTTTTDTTVAPAPEATPAPETTAPVDTMATPAAADTTKPATK